jgi:hypothetical protein
MKRANLCLVPPVAIPIVGHFSYNFLTDSSMWDQTQQQIYGFTKEIISFSDVLSCVASESRTKFQEQVFGGLSCCTTLTTGEIQLDSGNVVQETYRFNYNPDDYDMKSPESIEGSTTLLKVA